MITAGGTREPIDDVRHVANVASGRLPAAIGDAWLKRGAVVHYIHGPGAVVPGRYSADISLIGLTTEERLRATARIARELAHAPVLTDAALHLHPIQSAADAAATLQSVVAASAPDIVMCAMAVADYAPQRADGKLSSQEGELNVHMAPTPKTIDIVKKTEPGCLLIGFKLLSGASEQARAAACRHLAQRSGAELVFCNDMDDYRKGIRRGWLYGPTGEFTEAIGDENTDAAELAEALTEAVAARKT